MSFDRQGGSGGGPSNRQLGWLALAALVVVVIAVIVIVVSTTSSSNPSQTSALGKGTATVATTTTSAPTSTTASTPSTTTTVASANLTPAGGPVPSGFAPASFTAISDDVWWLMGQAPCSSPPCTSIVRSANAGRSWVGIPAPPTDNVSELRFANAQDGYAWGQELWSTHDGGAHWSQVQVSGTVQELAISDGTVYVAAGNGGLLRASVGSGSFSQIQSGDIASVWAQGSTVLADAQSASGTPSLISSSNGGSSFSSQAAPSATVQCDYYTTQLPVIWAECATGTEGGLWRSDDGGAQWASSGPSGQDSSGGESNGAPFAAASGQVAVYGSPTVYRTTDGGAVWGAVNDLPAAGGDSVTYLGFTDPEHGVAIVQASSGSQTTATLYATSNGGVSYSPVSIAAG